MVIFSSPPITELERSKNQQHADPTSLTTAKGSSWNIPKPTQQTTSSWIVEIFKGIGSTKRSKKEGFMPWNVPRHEALDEQKGRLGSFQAKGLTSVESTESK